MGWLVQATDYRKWNEPPRPHLQRNGTIYLMARRPLLCQGGDFTFPSGCPRRLCPADDLWVNRRPSATLSRGADHLLSLPGHFTQRAALLDGSPGFVTLPRLSRYTWWQLRHASATWLVTSLTAA